MPKFYEIKLIIGGGYFTLILFSLDMVNVIEEYKQANGMEELTEHDLAHINLPESVKIDIVDNNYEVKYRDAVYRSETNSVNFRPRP